MRMHVEMRTLDGVVVLVPEAFHDERGFFLESFRADQFQSLGLPHQFVQDNHSRSRRGVLRGLHFQYDAPMGKLMRVTPGLRFPGGGGYSQGISDPRPVVRRRCLRRKPAAGVGAGWICPRLLRYLGGGGSAV